MEILLQLLIILFVLYYDDIFHKINQMYKTFLDNYIGNISIEDDYGFENEDY